MAIKYSTSVNLPEEIIEEVLSRVPVKGLLKFRCVSKSWCRLIESEEFKKSQLEKSRKNTGFLEHRLIACYYHYGLYQCRRLQSLLNGACLYPIHELYGCEVVGSFNGLVCLEKYAKHFIMWNPSTRIINKLPEISVAANHTMHVRNCGMGWFESSGEYKIFAVVPDFEGKVYSSKTNSWKTVRLEEDSIMDVVNERQRVGLFVSGKLHWMIKSRFAVSFDLTSEVVELIELPLTPKSWHDPLLGVLGGYLCAMYDRSCGWSRVVDVWVMKEYGVKESWQKLEPPFPASAQFVQQENGELLLYFGDDFLVYSPTENVFHYLKAKLSYYVRPLLLCFDTLLSPKF